MKQSAIFCGVNAPRVHACARAPAQWPGCQAPEAARCQAGKSCCVSMTSRSTRRPAKLQRGSCGEATVGGTRLHSSPASARAEDPGAEPARHDKDFALVESRNCNRGNRLRTNYSHVLTILRDSYRLRAKRSLSDLTRHGAFVQSRTKSQSNAARSISSPNRRIQ